MKDWFKFVGVMAAVVGTMLVAYLFVLPLFAAGKIVGRESQKFDAETQAQVYDNSRQFQQGTNRDIARYCRDWRTSEGAAKAAVADLILSTASTYEGPLTAENANCIVELNR